MQPRTTKLNECCSNNVGFVDMGGKAAGTEGGVLKHYGRDEGCPKFDFLEPDE